MIQALPALVSNIALGPELPRESTFTAPCTVLASGWARAKRSAPRSPASSPSVSTITIVRFRGGALPIARAASMTVAVPIPSSLAPGLHGTES